MIKSHENCSLRGDLHKAEYKSRIHERHVFQTIHFSHLKVKSSYRKSDNQFGEIYYSLGKKNSILYFSSFQRTL